MDNVSQLTKRHLGDEVTHAMTIFKVNDPKLHLQLTKALQEHQAMECLETLILEVSRVLCVCAMQGETDLEVFSEKISYILEEYPIYKVFLARFLQTIDLHKINSSLSATALAAEENRARDFLQGFLMAP